MCIRDRVLCPGSMKKTTSTRFFSIFLKFPETSEKRNPALLSRLLIFSSEKVINSWEKTEPFWAKINLLTISSSTGKSPASVISLILYMSPSKISIVINSSCLSSEIEIIELFTEKLRYPLFL